MRLLSFLVLAMVLAIQYPLWMGKRGWLSVMDLESKVSAVEQKNDGLRARNAKLAFEVADLSLGTEAVEELARSELAMVKENEIFIQITQLP